MAGFKEYRKKRASWREEVVVVLLQLWEERLPLLRGTKRNSLVYSDIAVQLSRRGFHGFSPIEVKVKIHNLTNKYRDELKACASGSSPSYWTHYEKINSFLGGYKTSNLDPLDEESTEDQSLLFLKDQMKSRKPNCTLNSTSNEQELLDQQDEMLDETTNSYTDNYEVLEDFGVTAGRTTRKEFEPSPKNRSQVLLEDFEVADEVPTRQRFKPSPNNRTQMLDIKRRKLELLEKRASNKCYRDDDKSFFDSLLPFMKKMDMAEKMRCRIDIQKTVYNYAFSPAETSSNRYSSMGTQLSSVASQNSSPPISRCPAQAAANSIPCEDIKIEENHSN